MFAGFTISACTADVLIGGARPVADAPVVVLAPGQQVTAEEIIAHCKTLIAGYKSPRSVEFLDALPMTGAGKILKTKLREPFWKGRERGVA